MAGRRTCPLLARVLDPEKYPTAVRVGAAAGTAQGAAYHPEHAYEFGLRRVLDGLGVLIDDARPPPGLRPPAARRRARPVGRGHRLPDGRPEQRHRPATRCGSRGGPGCSQRLAMSACLARTASAASLSAASSPSVSGVSTIRGRRSAPISA